MSSSNTLTSLSRARSWAGVTSTNDDATLTALISEVSRFILNYLGRPALFSRAYNETLDGQGQAALYLKHWPVTAVNALTIDGRSVTASSGTGSNGYVLEQWNGMPAGAPQRLGLRGECFARGLSNISVDYNAGYKVTAEAWTVPSSGSPSVTVSAPYGNFGTDEGVAYANGTALSLTASSPLAGQYTVNSGVYGFAAADAGAGVLISYSYVPADIEHACVALVAERYRYRSRIGEISKSLGGQETASYSQKDMPEFVRVLLQPYRRVVPV